jgi:uncharacterized protein (TIGR02246 family)
MHRSLFLFCLFFASPALANPPPGRLQMSQTVLDTLDRQVKAWNSGDLKAFCAVYADDALFISPKGLTRGREAVLARYTKRYPDKAAMGELHIEVVEVRTGEARAGMVTVAGRWTLRYPDKAPLSGHTLIVWQLKDTAWRIVQDASM